MSLTAAALRRVAVAAQTTTAAGITWALASFAAWSWPAALATGAAIVLALFCASVAIAFFVTLNGLGLPKKDRIALMPADTRPAPLGIARALRCYASECMVVFRMFNWLQPFRSRLKIPPSADASPGRDAPTVLLVHGYGCNHAVWLDMAPHLAAAGYRCETIDLEPVLGDIDDYAAPLLARMHDIATRTGRPPLLVCHSMGGLAARAAQVRAVHSTGSEAPCSGIVTLGSPHHGCVLARHGSGLNARQMRWLSPWLRALADAETTAQRARIVSIFSWHDSIAGPAGTSWLEGARHVALRGIGHVSLLRHPDAIAATLDALAMLATRATGANISPAPVAKPRATEPT
ncbi:esterase/lipase family protein [Cupriavidus plantarum]|uniref:esterase/lipase family protein n=1 Tax=Cupriavidus plantarum TaxID=942865 RepID=UPI000EB46A57|nr:alpha/beta fold hydrolase [Cupriavidus plantarum]RLK45882.1 triacylglycerol esterase/lipase EstA (alpha/beta hydrolase family) [Cupriavidus plantarum]